MPSPRPNPGRHLLVVGLCGATLAVGKARPLETLLTQVSEAYAPLEGRTIRPAEGYLKHEYLIPSGFYKEMWDWDGFFIGLHLAHQDREKARYLKGWVQNFATSIDPQGYVPGCISTQGPRPIFGAFAMKPFLAQGALAASERGGDYGWVLPVWEPMRKVLSYRERTQYDEKWGLFFWDNAMQSGADNNVALTNDPKDPSGILAVDLSVFQLREYRAMARMAARLDKKDEAAQYAQKADRLREAILRHLWSEPDTMFFNRRRDSGQWVRRISYSNFVPLVEDVLSRKAGQAMIRRYLWNPRHMLSPYGLRSLSKADREYNNVSMIVPYSNWQGPIWINANYLYFVALKRHGFDAEAAELAARLGRMVTADIEKWGSMHENYHAETGEGLAPTPQQSPGGVFAGFVGWNLLVQDMLQCAAHGDCKLLAF